ncbi:hypothetical protein L1987_60195 [Smallanthus sonchifolius]|uniref:Uncharacterized protein n=1 Tax=Smallanthus sonchifolius TaxID=185202 RepID=A0ACB9D871_9ASTR|nr:hypothetical protein L1987_60195 [Smallanthus sonchifolius]
MNPTSITPNDMRALIVGGFQLIDSNEAKGGFSYRNSARIDCARLKPMPTAIGLVPGDICWDFGEIDASNSFTGSRSMCAGDQLWNDRRIDVHLTVVDEGIDGYELNTHN